MYKQFCVKIAVLELRVELSANFNVILEIARHQRPSNQIWLYHHNRK